MVLTTGLVFALVVMIGVPISDVQLTAAITPSVSTLPPRLSWR